MYLYGEVTKKVGFVSADSWRVWKSTASLDSVDRTSVSQIQFSFPHENNTLIYVRLLRFSHNIMILPWAYLLFVIFFTQTKFLENKIYTEKRVNYDKLHSKLPILRVNYDKLHSKLPIFRIKS